MKEAEERSNQQFQKAEEVRLKISEDLLVLDKTSKENLLIAEENTTAIQGDIQTLDQSLQDEQKRIEGINEEMMKN